MQGATQPALPSQSTPGLPQPACPPAPGLRHLMSMPLQRHCRAPHIEGVKVQRVWLCCSCSCCCIAAACVRIGLRPCCRRIRPFLQLLLLLLVGQGRQKRHCQQPAQQAQQINTVAAGTASWLWALPISISRLAGRHLMLQLPSPCAPAHGMTRTAAPHRGCKNRAGRQTSNGAV